MGTRRPRRGSRLCTRWALQWREDGQLLGQCLRPTKCDKLSDKSYDIPLVCQRVSKQSTWKRRILLTVSSAPVQGTPMIMTEAYRRILERAAHGQLPPWVVEQSEPGFRVIRALYEEKCLEPFLLDENEIMEWGRISHRQH